ncbi:hypothetical protein GEMRC1_007168 [Eukaryota sp. GEM-RC1]
MSSPINLICHLLLCALLFIQIISPVQTMVKYISDVTSTFNEFFLPEDMLNDEEPDKELVFYFSSIDETVSVITTTVHSFYELNTTSLSMFYICTEEQPQLVFNPFSFGWTIPDDSKTPSDVVLHHLTSSHNLSVDAPLADLTPDLLHLCLLSAKSMTISFRLNNTEITSSGPVVNQWQVTHQFSLPKGSASVRYSYEYERLVLGFFSLESLRMRLFLDISVLLTSLTSLFLLVIGSQLPLKTLFRERRTGRRIQALGSTPDFLQLLHQQRPLLGQIKTTAPLPPPLFSLWSVVMIVCCCSAGLGSFYDLVACAFNQVYTASSTVRFLQGLGAMTCTWALCSHYETQAKFYLLITTLKRSFVQAFNWFFSILPVFMGYSFLGFALFGNYAPWLFWYCGSVLSYSLCCSQW